MKHFYSNNKKIIPELSDDWRIISQKNGQKTLFSQVLSQEIRNIPANNILDFIIENNVKVEDNYIDQILAVIEGKKLVNMEEFQEGIEETIDYIDYSELKQGYLYTDSKGREIVYLGWRYVSKIKHDNIDRTFKYTHIKKEYFYVPYSDIGLAMRKSVSVLTKDILNEDGRILNKDEVNRLLLNFYHRELKYVYFSKDNIKNPQYKLIPAVKSNSSLFVETSLGLVGTEMRYIKKRLKKKTVLGVRVNKDENIILSSMMSTYDPVFLIEDESLRERVMDIKIDVNNKINKRTREEIIKSLEVPVLGYYRIGV